MNGHACWGFSIGDHRISEIIPATNIDKVLGSMGALHKEAFMKLEASFDVALMHCTRRHQFQRPPQSYNFQN